MYTKKRILAVLLSVLLCGLTLLNAAVKPFHMDGALAEDGEFVSEGEMSETTPSDQAMGDEEPAQPQEPDPPEQPQEPEPTEKPEETERPIETEKPTETEKPIETETPKAPEETPRPEIPEPTPSAMPPEGQPTPSVMPPEGQPAPLMPEPSLRPMPSEVRIGRYDTPSAAPGGTISFALPIQCQQGENTYSSNAGASGGIVPYSPGQGSGDFDPAIALALRSVRVSIASEQEAGLPLSPEGLGQGLTLVSGGHNAGYAAFEPIRVIETAQPGTYALRVRVQWTDMNGIEGSKSQTVRFEVKTLEAAEDDESAEDPEAAIDVTGSDEEKDTEGDVEAEDKDTDDEIDDEGEADDDDLDDENNDEGEADDDEDKDIDDEGEPEDEDMATDDEPEEAEEDGLDAETPGEVMLGHVQLPTVTAGQTLTLIIPMTYGNGDETYSTNVASDGATIPYQASHTPEQYDQSITAVLDSLSVGFSEEQDELTPFEPEVLTGQRSIIADGQNFGYAAFAELPILEDAQAGSYAVTLWASWRKVDEEALQSKSFTLSVTVGEMPADRVEVGVQEPFAVAPGEMTVTLAIPIRYRTWEAALDPAQADADFHEVIYETNAQTQSSFASFFSGDSSFGAYDQAITEALTELSVGFASDQAANCPLSAEALSQKRTIIANGRNVGYARFEDLSLEPLSSLEGEAAEKDYPIKLRHHRTKGRRYRDEPTKLSYGA